MKKKWRNKRKLERKLWKVLLNALKTRNGRPNGSFPNGARDGFEAIFILFSLLLPLAILFCALSDTIIVLAIRCKTYFNYSVLFVEQKSCQDVQCLSLIFVYYPFKGAGDCKFCWPLTLIWRGPLRATYCRKQTVTDRFLFLIILKEI